MTIQVLSLDFAGEGGVLLPRDPKLHALAVEYAERELRDPVNFTDYRKVFVVCELDDDGQPVKVHGLMCGVGCFDFPVVRFTNPEAAAPMFERARAFLEDQGLRGQEVFLKVEDREPEEARCPAWREWLSKFKATNAQRWKVRV